MNPASPPPAPSQSGSGHRPPGYGPTPMPTSVRAARIVAFVVAVLSVAASVLAGVLGDSRLAGAVMGANLLNLVLGMLAFGFSAGRNGLRITCIVLAAMQVLFTFGALTRLAGGGGLLPLAADIALIVLLAQSSAKTWFKRDR